MSIATLKTAVTRKVHAIAVGLHIAALRGEVKVQIEAAYAADRAATLATAAATKAEALEDAAHNMAEYLHHKADTFREQATEEAATIGGTL